MPLPAQLNTWTPELNRPASGVSDLGLTPERGIPEKGRGSCIYSNDFLLHFNYNYFKENGLLWLL